MPGPGAVLLSGVNPALSYYAVSFFTQIVFTFHADFAAGAKKPVPDISAISGTGGFMWFFD
jgi:hypothetical protein